MIINYGINRRWKIKTDPRLRRKKAPKIEHQNGRVILSHFPTVAQMMDHVKRVHPGWTLTGYVAANQLSPPDPQLEITKAVRGIMRTAGVPGYNIFTNRYARSRSVKCYVKSSNPLRLKRLIANHLNRHGIKFEMYIRDNRRFMLAKKFALIVRLPFAK